MKTYTVQFLSDPQDYREKENLYLEVRRREGRVLPDTVVKNLPDVPPESPYTREWAWRKRTTNRFLARLAGDSERKVLDLGCGNGWMSNQLAKNPQLEVWAVDLNREELEQGCRIFGRENLRFIFADVLQGVLPQGYFDVIVLAASVQYFPDFETLISSLRNLLTAHGEIHMLDSPFYKTQTEQEAARQRTADYYAKTGVPGMARFYHHHLWPEAVKLGAENLNNSLKIKFLQKIKHLAPFPWWRMRH